jgi:CheY-like chemotaxis protein/HPt (histidine-containing phosphotransfer) domain-containing protein
MLELTLDTTLTPEQEDYLRTSLQSAEALLVLLNDILDFSKIEEGRFELDHIDFNLRTTVEDVAYTLAGRAQQKGLEMACLIHPDLSSSLRGDPARLRQILINLVGNAIKFTHQGEIVIRAEPVEQSATHASIRFSVQDTGIGIPADRQAAVFERFTQADGSTTRKYGGSGLGLTISRQLVETMGGRIGLESEPGVGSTFWFQVRLEKQPLQKRGTAPLNLAPVMLRGTRILGVDDNLTNRSILAKMVEGFGCRIDMAATGAKGLEMLHTAARAKDPYQLVLLDMQMPGMDGEQTTREIKTDPLVKDTKIVILTSMGQRGDAIRLEALGCSGYLLKPVKQQMLYDALVAVLGQDEQVKPGLVTRHVLSEKKRQGLRILLAEDNPINQKLAVILLQKQGYSVDAVDTGTQVVEKARSEQYHAILMDVSMPEMDGFEATRLIRAWESGHGQHIPIIAMTAHAMQGDRERCLLAGMDDYLSKPLEPLALFNALDRWVPIGEETQTEAAPGEEVQDYTSAPEPFSHEVLADEGLFGEAAAPAGKKPQVPAPAPGLGLEQGLPLDFDEAIHRFDGDRAFMLEMCREFIAHLPGRLQEIHAALAASDANSLSRHAHNLKGTSLNFSAAPLAGVAAELEKQAREENLGSAPELVRQLDAQAKRLEEYLATQLSQELGPE